MNKLELAKQHTNKQGLYDEMLMPALSKEVWDWFNKPIKKGVVFVSSNWYKKEKYNMNKTELAKQLNKKYQEIATQKDYKGNRTLLEWENLPATDRFVWERMAEVVENIIEREKILNPALTKEEVLGL